MLNIKKNNGINIIKPCAHMITEYLKIARPDHWFKNLFMLPGVALALVLTGIPFQQALLPLILAVISTCLIASANYVINEWLDAEFDRHHPVKKHRPSAVGNIQAQVRLY